MFTYYCPQWDEPTKIYYTLIEPYEQMTGKKFCKRKTIWDDTPDKTENNILVVPLEPPEAFGDREFEYWPHIQYGLDHGMKIYIDYSWEYMECSKTHNKAHFFWSKHRKYLEENNIKIITQYWPSSAINVTWDESLSKITHSINMFEYHMRICHEAHNADYRIKTAPPEKKKHLVNFIPGEIRKYPATLMLQSLLETLQEKDIFYSSIIGEYYNKWFMDWDDREQIWYSYQKHFSDRGKSLFDRAFENKAKLHQHKPFELLYGDSEDIGAHMQTKERRIPQGVYDSHCSIIAECSWHAHFYTEKTWKHVMAEKPFIIHAGEGINEGITQFGYELYDEIFDYTFDDKYCPTMEQSHWCIIDNINNLNENRAIFDSPTVRDKTRWNRDNLLRRTTLNSFIQEIEKLIG